MYKKIFDSKNAPREEWLKVRKLGLGGSDMSAVLGVNQWRSPLDVWLDPESGKLSGALILLSGRIIPPFLFCG